MARTTHFQAPAAIPVYALAFLDEDTFTYAGGGGAGRSGVSNAIRTVRIKAKEERLELLHELKLSREEDAPMCMASNAQTHHLVCGINSSSAAMSKGDNETLRLFEYDLAASTADASATAKDSSDSKTEVRFSKSAKSLNIDDAEHYQKVSVFSKSGRFLAAASTNGLLALHRFPSLAPAWQSPTEDFAGQELFDADFSEDNAQVVFASGKGIRVYSTLPLPLPALTPAAAEAAEKALPDPDDETSAAAKTAAALPPTLLQVIQNPALGGTGTCSFRSARFGRGDPDNGGTRHRLFTVVNAGQAAKKGKARKSFVTAWDADTWQLIETRNVSDRPVTVFDVSADGSKLAYGSSDLSVGVLDARTLRPIVKILDAHGFPPTCLKFSPSGRTLVSASADNTLRVIDVPDKGVSAQGGNITATILIAILLVLIAIYLQQRLVVK